MAVNFQDTTREYDIARTQAVASIVTDSASTAIAATEVLLHASKACYVHRNTAASSTKFPLADNEKFHMQITPGDIIHVIRATEDGTLFIVPVK